MKRGERKAAPGVPFDEDSLRGRSAQFLKWCAVQNLSPATVYSWKCLLKNFCDWCAERNVERPSDVTRQLLEQYQTGLFHRRKKNGEPLAFQTQYGALVAVKQMFRWLTRHDLVLSNPASDLQMPKVPKRLPVDVLNAKEVELVMEAVVLDEERHGLRDRAMLEVLYSTGMRRAELCRLGLYDVDHHRGVATIRSGKGQKDRVIPIGERALSWVARYVADERPRWAAKQETNDHDQVLFLGQDGFPLRADSISGLVHSYVVKANIGKVGSAHLLRHTMATLMLEGGADIRFIQMMLGHANLSTTEIYTHVSIGQLKDVHNRAHPGARLGHAALDEETKTVLAAVFNEDAGDDT